MAHIKSSLPTCLDPLRFAYRRNRSIEDAISLALHSSVEHLDNKNTYFRLLLVDYSSALNTIIPPQTDLKTLTPRSWLTISNWILSFMTHRSQSAMVDNCTSSTITLNAGAPQRCILSPLLCSLYTHDCVAKFHMNTIYKFADNTAVVGRTSNNDESEYRKEMEGLVMSCNDNNLSLNVSKTKELIIDFRKKWGEHAPIYINGAEVDRAESVKFLGDHKKLQKVACTAQTITEANLPSMDSIYRPIAME
eukprot:g44176.t1